MGSWEPDQEERDRTLFVANLTEEITEELLYELFVQVGPLNRVSLKKSANKPPIAFITFQHSESVPFAVAVLDGTRLFRKAISTKPRDGSTHVKRQRELNQEARYNRTPQGQTPPLAGAQISLMGTPEGPAMFPLMSGVMVVAPQNSPAFATTPRWMGTPGPAGFIGGPFPLGATPQGAPQGPRPLIGQQPMSMMGVTPQNDRSGGERFSRNDRSRGSDRNQSSQDRSRSRGNFDQSDRGRGDSRDGNRRRGYDDGGSSSRGGRYENEQDNRGSGNRDNRRMHDSGPRGRSGGGRGGRY